MSELITKLEEKDNSIKIKENPLIQVTEVDISCMWIIKLSF